MKVEIKIKSNSERPDVTATLDFANKGSLELGDTHDWPTLITIIEGVKQAIHKGLDPVLEHEAQPLNQAMSNTGALK